jgi:hypothetical protein
MAGHLMAVIDYLFVSSLCSAGNCEVLFLLKLPCFQALTPDFLKTMECRNQQIITAGGRREVYDKIEPKLLGGLLRVVFTYLGRSSGDFFVICWRYLFLQHSYLTSKHPLGVSIFDSKSVKAAVPIRKKIHAMVAPTFEHAYHHKIDAFLSIKSIRSTHVLLNVIKYQLLGQFDQGEFDAFLQVLESWPEGHAIAAKLIPQFNHLPFAFFDHPHGQIRSRQRSIYTLRLRSEAKLGAENGESDSSLPGLEEPVSALKQ